MVESIRKCIKHNPYAQWIVTLGVLLLMQQTGIMGGWTSPNVARLTSENSPIPLTLEQASWVASCLNLGRFGGALFGSIFIDLLGSKKTVLLALFPVSISWILLILADSVEWLYASRLIGGVTFGMAYGSFSIFLGEITSPAVRGSLITIAMCGTPLGSILSSICESYLPMKISSSIYLLECLVAIALFLWLPNSPHCLVKLNEIDSAQKAIAWYHGNNEVEKELDSVKSFVEANSTMTLKDKLRECRSPRIMKTLILVMILFIFPQMCGLFNILFYMEVILIKGKSFLVNPQEFVIYANVVAFFATVIATKLIDKLGRRFLLLVSSIGTAVGLTGLGTHFYLLGLNVDSQNLQWLPVVSILLFTITFSIGFMIVPSTILSEIFPYNVKSVASCLTSMTSSFFGFLAAKSYQPMVDAFGEAYVFWIHAVFSALATPIVLFLLPETKGKTFQEIQNDLFKK